ncbi:MULTISPECIES: hypothetical protein [Rhizobium]|uniref:Uncharacterized protein n=1 Tax=Rhizobium paranaense TaxID=1650438 RepID=A0A7W8XVX5_9HYPH|nr:hypothetical protein [Rhizobium paranaense]MBB5576584.1 hypothetical protein [Rhizobium paranaense]
MSVIMAHDLAPSPRIEREGGAQFASISMKNGASETRRFEI